MHDAVSKLYEFVKPLFENTQAISNPLPLTQQLPKIKSEPVRKCIMDAGYVLKAVPICDNIL